MRNAVINTITALAESNDRICIVTADLGYSVMEGFAEKFPDRFFNVGIAEQAMASIAAGLALSGDIAVTYSIGNFSTLRCIEQIRNDVCYHNANVKVIAVGGGVSYGQLGMSHHATEDLAMMRALPNMTVLTPADPEEATAAAQYAIEHAGPFYIRLARRGEPVLYQKQKDFDVQKIQQVLPGKEAAIFGCGPITAEAKKAGELLQETGIDAAVYSVPCISPLDKESIVHIANQTKWLFTVEEHQVNGGLGGAMAEIVSELEGARLVRLGLPGEFPHVVGSHDYLCKFYGMDAEGISQTVKKTIG